MLIKDERIDHGKAFDWGRTSADYAKYRDIYPREFYEKILDRGLCRDGQTVLDIGTGTGVLPRTMYPYGAKWTGTDISEEQIRQARQLSADKDIRYLVSATEQLSFPENTFDVITACQCIWYFKHEEVAPMFYRMLKPGGHMLILYMAWLPYEDRIAGASEDLVLKYSPGWSGAGETVHPISVPEAYTPYFEMEYHEEYRLTVPFTRESWNGRMKSCRGIGASLTEEEIRAWEQEHRKLLAEIAPESFEILHYGAIAELRVRKDK